MIALVAPAGTSTLYVAVGVLPGSVNRLANGPGFETIPLWPAAPSTGRGVPDVPDDVGAGERDGRQRRGLVGEHAPGVVRPEDGVPVARAAHAIGGMAAVGADADRLRDRGGVAHERQEAASARPVEGTNTLREAKIPSVGAPIGCSGYPISRPPSSVVQEFSAALG